MPATVIAFDVDGTLDSSQGPVPVLRLTELRGYGFHIWIVSPSSNRPGGFEEAVTGERVANLRQVRIEELSRDPLAGTFVYLYVSDNKDYDAARQAGFSYIEAGQFV
jgi:hypothetical protein